MTRYERRFRKVARSLSKVELMRSSMDETFAITDKDLLDKDAGRRFLDFYGDEGLRLALERYGLFDALRDAGWTDFRIETWAHDERHTLLIEGVPAAGGERDRLIELVVRRDRLCIAPPAPDRSWEVLTVDWLTLRNPIGRFTKRRMRLPGQDAPGLGVGERVLEMLYRVVDRLSLDGLVTVAEYFHNAVLYARELPFVDPWYQGQLAALTALLFEREGLEFAQAAWAMHWGYVLDADDSVVRWKGEAMVRPFEEELAAYIGSPEHRAAARRAEQSLRYHLARAPFEERWRKEEPSLLEKPAGPDDE
ncbi:MAG TPA: hypothetical protein VIL20_23875 [Sandaracinaceae bacterium]